MQTVFRDEDVGAVVVIEDPEGLLQRYPSQQLTSHCEMDTPPAPQARLQARSATYCMSDSLPWGTPT